MPRPRKPLTREKRILAIEERLRNPEIGDKQFASLNHQLMLLKGEIVPYQKPAPKPKPEPEPKKVLTLEERWEQMTPQEQEEFAARIHKDYERGKELDAWREANAEIFKADAEKHERQSLLLTLGQSTANVPKAKPTAKTPAPVPEENPAVTEQNLENYYKINGY